MTDGANQLLRQLLIAGQLNATRRKCFISYYSGDSAEVGIFLRDFGDVFIPKVIGVGDGDDFINSNDTNYVMSRVREKYLGDSTVTILLIGACTHSRRYVDWELKASLRQGEYIPNGLLGIVLPSLGGSSHLPPRFKDNWDAEKACFASYHPYPISKEQLRNRIDVAYARRTTHAHLIKNTQEMHKYSRACIVHKETH